MKEATATATVVSIVASLASMVPQLGISTSGFGWRCIPILSTAIGLNDIFMMEYSVSDIAVTCAVNMAVALVLVFVLTKMFNSEKIMFKKG